jgi:hypothetical protein
MSFAIEQLGVFVTANEVPHYVVTAALCGVQIALDEFGRDLQFRALEIGDAGCNVSGSSPLRDAPAMHDLQLHGAPHV